MKNLQIEVRVCSVKRFCRAAEERDGAGGVAAIFCSMQSIPEEGLGGVSCLHLRFADVTDPKRSDAFSVQMAQQVRSFVERLQGGELFLCCDSGESRSAALAAAILRALGRDERVIWKSPSMHPNALVYHLQCRAFGCFSTRFRTRLLCRYNQRAFRRACRR